MAPTAPAGAAPGPALAVAATSGGLGDLVSSHERKTMLRFITCGSVDDGKSTLIGRMLYDSRLVLEDQLMALEADSKRVGTQDGELDLALLVDGLAAEREQGITIDVAYRFFSTQRRSFVVADTPGHEQYTRNMVTGASTAELAVILVDGRKGVLTQTRRHSFIVALLGIRHVVLAVNKLDLVDYSAEAFAEIDEQYRSFAASIGLGDVVSIPISALRGDNIITASSQMPWYSGPTMIGHLEAVDVADEVAQGPFRFPVQWVNRPDLDFRGFCGQIVGGRVAPGDRLRVLPSGLTSSVARLVTADGDLAEAVAGQSITVVLSDEVDVSRGDVLAAADDPPTLASHLEVNVIWMGEEEMVPGRPYLLKMGTRIVTATPEAPRYTLDVNSGEHHPAKTLGFNGIGLCELRLDQPVAFDPYRANRDMGGLILIDRLSNATVAAGLVRRGISRGGDVVWQSVGLDKEARSASLRQRPGVVWLTGLSGSGKSTIANALEFRLHAAGTHTYLLDGDNVRHGLNSDLGFESSDRAENIRRVGEVAALMVDAGLMVLVAFISPFRSERRLARELFAEGEFMEIFVDASLEVAESRDVKGLYARARRGEIANFTGIDSPYEVPEDPEMHLDTSSLSADEAVDLIMEDLRRRGFVGGS